MRAFLFDLDGTLVDSERENADSVVEVLRARGRQVSDEERAFVVGHGWREIYDHLVAGGGVTLGYDELKERAAIVKERLCEARGLRILPGAVAFVRRAASFGPCAVVTGSSRREAEWTLRKLALDGAVRALVAAEDAPRGKPSPDPYLEAAKRLGVPPSACIAFEDSLHGIRAAKAAGMKCVALAAGNFLGHDQSGADLVAASFEALGDRLWEA